MPRALRSSRAASTVPDLPGSPSLARFYMYGADFEEAARIGQEILRLADSQDDAGCVSTGT